jgi:rSAM/selenodomain-associated transferase 2
MTPTFSFIIPVLHEETVISGTIRHIRSLRAFGADEIIIVDGDPEGKTIDAIQDMGVITLISEKGRGVQMNRGAALATGEILIFLHADTVLPHDALKHIETVMQDKTVIAGAFDLSIDSEKVLFRVIEKAASCRSRITRIPYGDQAIFMRRSVFNDMGGFKNIPIMEDVEIMQRIKKQRGRICIVDRAVRTSSRRWEREGIIYGTLRNWLLLFLYHIGVKPEKLVRFYQ